MYLKELSTSGFKSFAKKSSLTFDAPITAIVGPNGSGKSNVAESFRFVLGEQSVKSMRGKRGEDLIWGGSESVARGNRAGVQVTLNNESRVFPLDFDEIRVERVVHRDGQNEYSINGSKVRLRDVQELLSAANIGPSGHHIISQGEADRILSASAKERREMIEDALGLKAYQYKKQEAEKKLSKTKENMSQVESLRREHAPHLRYLEKQIKRIEKSIEVQKQLEGSYSEYLRREDVYIAHHYDRLTNARVNPASRLEALKDDLSELKKISSTVSEQGESVALREAKQAFEAIRNEKTSLLKQLGQLEGQMHFLKRRLSQPAATEGESEMVSRQELVTVVGELEQEVDEALRNGDGESAKNILQSIVSRLRTFLDRSKTHVVDTTATDAAELEDIESQHTKLSEDIVKLEEQETAARDRLSQIENEQQAEQAERHESERRYFELLNEQRELELSVKEIDRELSVLERDRAEFKRELQEAVVLIGSAAARYFDYVISKDGQTITPAMMAAESREIQRERRHELEKLKIRLEELGVGSTEAVMKEYETAKERDDFLAKELADLQSSVENLEALIADLAAQLDEQFVSGIEKINVEFNKFFVLMFGGGSAGLEKKKVQQSTEEGEDEVVEEGIELTVQLPNKRVRGLDMLSGGERALSSIALIFAMSQVNPPLFIILDETDAALDEANSRRYGDMIEALSKNSQLILITHNRETMSRAQILYGVTMGGDGVSKLLSVKFDEALAVAK